MRQLIQNPVNGSKQGCKSQITRLVLKVEKKKVPFLGRRSANRRWELPSTLPLFSTYADSPSADRLRFVSGQKRGDKRMILDLSSASSKAECQVVPAENFPRANV